MDETGLGRLPALGALQPTPVAGPWPGSSVPRTELSLPGLYLPDGLGQAVLKAVQALGALAFLLQGPADHP
ncbi:hypothetical protein SAMN05444921_10126 [Streptomyces wuyuanensis]|uniref:Uncharacterized protein n=1 Tax=Streptomyces wuyuanensis TaxID=1196353 RepID=A0A1G9MDK4_9ACTN|nr:hypothetical protein SAMN05444921_10126 [Streptomyces wuyuanensis]